MMVATLDALAGAVELVVFNEQRPTVEELINTDSTMIVRGRVDHKEPGTVAIVVTAVEKFDPTDAEIEKAKAKVAKLEAARPVTFNRRVDATQLPATVVDDLRELFERYPGDCEFVLEMHTRTGLRRLKFGAGFKVPARNAAMKAELDALLGPPPVAAPVPA